MNLHWLNLTPSQKSAISLLCESGPCALPRELAEQLINLGLVERVSGAYCISSLGLTVVPTTIH